MSVLDNSDLQAGIADLEGWEGAPASGISKTFKLADFNGSVEFLNRVAEIADGADHHPDVAISWNKVTLTYITHSKNGVTQADIDQAHEIEHRLV